MAAVELSSSSAAAADDRFLALKEFDESKAGVKGLVDAGVTSLPPFFIHRNLTLTPARRRLAIPTLDLFLPRPTVVDLVRSAAATSGFFHIVNHGVPAPVIDGAIAAVRSFNELPLEARSRHYSREFRGGVSYASNLDLFRSVAASWRDTVQIQLGPTPPERECIPAACRDEVLALGEHTHRVAMEVMGLLAEGLGAAPGRLEETSCGEGSLMACHYYPQCPEPGKTLGLAAHTDPGVVTVLVQDKVGGLQVKMKAEDGEGEWVDVEPVDGALVINVGELLQIMSNDVYKSVEHRVIANPHDEARVSIGVFFNPGKRGGSDLYGPLPELVSEENPAVYRSFTMTEFLTTFFSKGLASKCPVDYFKLRR